MGPHLPFIHTGYPCQQFKAVTTSTKVLRRWQKNAWPIISIAVALGGRVRFRRIDGEKGALLLQRPAV